MSKKKKDKGSSNHLLPPSESPCFCFNLRKVTRIITQIYDEKIRANGLRANQLTLLKALHKTGRITMSTLSGHLYMDRTTLSRNLKPLERDGLVTIEPGKDRRQRWIQLTKEGEKLHQKLLPIWEENQELIAKLLGQERFSQTLKDLNQMAEELLPYSRL